MARMEEKNVEKLILLIREYSELYDMSDKNYSNQLRRDNIWRDIAGKLGESAETCKNKWKHLRDGFQRASKNVTKSGQAAKAIRKWRFWDTMSFLIPYVKGRQHHSNLTEEAGGKGSDDEEDEGDTQSEAYTENHEDVVDVLENTMSPTSREVTLNTPSPSTSASQLEYDSKKAKPTSKRKGTQPSSDTVPQLFKEYIDGKKLKLLEKESSKQRVENDPLIEFFINMGKTVKTFPRYHQAQVKSKVFQIVNSTEMELLMPKDHPASTASTSYPTNATSYQTGNIQYHSMPQFDTNYSQSNYTD